MKKGLIPQGLNLAASVGRVVTAASIVGILWKHARFLWQILRSSFFRAGADLEVDHAAIRLLPTTLPSGVDKVHSGKWGFSNPDVFSSNGTGRLIPSQQQRDGQG